MSNLSSPLEGDSIQPYHDMHSLAIFVYTQLMARRTTLMVDDALLARAQEALGTEGLKDTVEMAFREAIRRHLRSRLADRILSGDGIDRSPELLEEIRPGR